MMDENTISFIEVLQNTGATSEEVFKAVENGYLAVDSYDTDGVPKFSSSEIERIASKGDGVPNIRELVVSALQRRADRLIENATSVREIAGMLDGKQKVNIRAKVVPAGTVEDIVGSSFDLKDSEIDAGV